MTDAYPPPTLPERAEVAIIGAGIAGCATAYFLAKAGVPVVVLEKGRIAGEQSSRNWGWVRKQGRDPRELPAIIESLKIWPGLEQELEADIGWKQAGVTYVATNEEQLAKFEEWLGFAKPYQLDSRLLTSKETDDLLGTSGERYLGALHTPSDGRAEPATTVPAIAKAIERLGGRVIEGCAVRTVETQAGRVSGVATEHGTIACASVVCAAGAWSSLFNRNLGIRLPQLRVRSSVLRTEPAPLVTESATWCGDFAFRRRQDGGYTIAADGGSTFEIVPDAFRFFSTFFGALR
ncbi:MAG: FAD-binding oxidoreductase, partial [Alphaproteobacteria bacterium]|nr:FAD-binding oxidoreductase [Alphaproteobacteria bacterium]